MNIIEMTKKQFLKLPHREWDVEVECDSIIILPSEINYFSRLKYDIQKFLSEHLKFIKEPEIYNVDGMHDSGFRTMDFVAVKDNEAICLLSGCSDVVHIDGIGGFGYNWLNEYGHCPALIKPVGWSMDCLPKSGLLRLWCNKGVICDKPFSSFEVFANNKTK